MPREDLAAYNRMVEYLTEIVGLTRPNGARARDCQRSVEASTRPKCSRRAENSRDRRRGHTRRRRRLQKNGKAILEPSLTALHVRPVALGPWRPPASGSGEVDDPNNLTCWSTNWRPLRKGARPCWMNGRFYAAGLRITSPGSRPTDSRPYACSGNNLLTWPSIGESCSDLSHHLRDATRLARRLRTMISSATW